MLMFFFVNLNDNNSFPEESFISFSCFQNKIPDPTKEIPLQILLNKEVENIRWGTNHRGLDNPLVQVTCKDGSLYAAKSVIVTLSVGVLKER